MVNTNLRSRGILFLPYSPESLAIASSAFNLFLDYFNVWGSYFCLALLADKDIYKFSCMSFGELNHFYPLTCFIIFSFNITQYNILAPSTTWPLNSSGISMSNVS